MHRTLGDGYVTDAGKYVPSINVYADEAPPTRDATQLRHEEMNAIQEEIANVIEGEGYSLNPAMESPAQMCQLEAAINAKVNRERILRDAAIAVEANTRAQADVSEEGSRAFEDNKEIAARQAADAALQAQITGTVGAFDITISTTYFTVAQTVTVLWRLDVNGVVELYIPKILGISNSANLFSNAAALPAAIRPAEVTYFPVTAILGSSILLGTLALDPSGIMGWTIPRSLSEATPRIDLNATPSWPSSGAKGIAASCVRYKVA